MKSFFKTLLINFIINLIIINVVIGNNSSLPILRRGKRYLDFLDKSRMTFRITIRNNILKVNRVFAYAYGLRANLPIETDHLHYLDFNVHPHHPKKRSLTRRAIFKTLEDLIDAHGLDGRACILKSFCEASKSTREGYKTGMLFKIFQLIFKLQDQDKNHFPYLREENCDQLLHQHCPFGFDNISPYTDEF